MNDTDISWADRNHLQRQTLDPVTELVSMVGPEKVVIVEAPKS